jgi:hypothetical protein
VGFIEGQNVAMEYRSTENQNDRLPLLVADLLRRQVALIARQYPIGARGNRKAFAKNLPYESSTARRPMDFGTRVLLPPTTALIQASVAERPIALSPED